MARERRRGLTPTRTSQSVRRRTEENAHDPLPTPVGSRVVAGADVRRSGHWRQALRRPRPRATSGWQPQGSTSSCCTIPAPGDYAPQPDTCLHERLVERRFTFGGRPGVMHDVRLRIRGLFEPTTIEGGDTPYRDHPYYKAGRTISAHEWSAWHIEVSSPRQTFWQSLSEGLAHDLRGRLRGDDSGGRRQRRGRSRRRWQRSTDRQRQARAARPPSDHQGRRRSAARGTARAPRRHRRHRR